jgi:hypothetical protein
MNMWSVVIYGVLIPLLILAATLMAVVYLDWQYYDMHLSSPIQSFKF